MLVDRSRSSAELLSEVASRSRRQTVVFWAAAAAITVFLYWLALRFLFPGYFHPLSPFHVDFYDYGAPAARSVGSLLRGFPRPVTYLFCKLIATPGLTPMMAAGVALVLLNQLLTLALAMRLLRLPATWPLVAAFACYTLVLFAHPQFYIEHRHDLPAEVSWLFLVIALTAWLQASRAISVRPLHAIIAGLGIVLFAFAKETYFVSAILIIAGLALAESAHRRRHLLFAAYVVVVEVASFQWTGHFKGPFVNLAADPTSSYYVSLQPKDVLRTFLFYVQYLLNPAIVVMAALAVYCAWSYRDRLILSLTLILAALAAFATHAVLPNHKFEEYSWSAAPLLLAPVLLCGAVEATQRRTFTLAALTGLTVLAIFGPKGFRSEYNTDASQWWIGQDQRGAQLAHSFAQLKPLSGRILITGLQDPGVPWQREEFADYFFGANKRWGVVLPASVTYRRNTKVAQFLDPAQVQLAQYDHVARYGADGRLVSLQPARELAGDPIPHVISPDLAACDRRAQSAPSNDYVVLLACARNAIDWAFWPEALSYLQRAEQRISDPAHEETFQELKASLPPSHAGQLAKSGEDPAAIPAHLFHRAELRAEPAHIRTSDRSGLGIADLYWTVPSGQPREIHVSSPNGPLFMHAETSGHGRTEKWVKNGMLFFLQDVSHGKPLTLDNTIAVVRVEVD